MKLRTVFNSPQCAEGAARRQGPQGCVGDAALTTAERLRRFVRAVAVLLAGSFGTQTVQLELVAHQLEAAQAVGHLVLQLLDGVVLELEDEPALHADQMIVVAMPL